MPADAPTPAATDTWHTETLYAVTDLGFSDVCPDQLAESRQHWPIDNKLHWIQDVTSAEDHFPKHTGNGPAVMATLRNFALSRHRIHPALATALLVARHPGDLPARRGHGSQAGVPEP